MKDAVQHLINKLEGFAPRIAMVLGSGLGDFAKEVEKPIRIPYGELAGFPHGGVSGHAGEIVAGYVSGIPVLVLAGRVHYYEQGDAGAMRPVLETLSAFGMTHLLLTNAAGSVREDMPPGSVMIIEDHINFSGSNPLFGEPTDKRFVGLTNAYDSAMRAALEAAAKARRLMSKRASICGSPARRSRHRRKSAWRASSARTQLACRPCRK